MAIFSAVEENLLIALLRFKAVQRDISNSRICSAVFAELADHFSRLGVLGIDGVEIAKTIEAIRARYHSFVWFVSKPGVYYIEENNWVIATNEYMLQSGQNESAQHRQFKLHGFPNFLLVKEIFEDNGMENVDLVWISHDLGTEDKEWIGNPSNESIVHV